jgi:ubiquinone/menaquinone biosynthesis C-methylase UbiE
VTLLLGPLYHLVEVRDRAQALSEAARVTRPGGLVVAAGINRYAGLLECGSSGGLTEAIERDCLEAFERGRGYDNPNGLADPRLISASFHFLARGTVV